MTTKTISTIRVYVSDETSTKIVNLDKVKEDETIGKIKEIILQKLSNPDHKKEDLHIVHNGRSKSNLKKLNEIDDLMNQFPPVLYAVFKKILPKK